MRINELAIKTETELEKMVLELQDKLRDMRFRVARRELKNVREIRTIKKDIAKIKTILNKNGSVATGKNVK